ncbi:MAG: hypothetical protein RLZZ458_1388 [Planctomycetota bacterium]
MNHLRPAILLCLLSTLVPLAPTACRAALVTLPTDEASTPPTFSDQAIDGALNSVMQSDDFRSVRRRVLEQIPVPDDSNSDGFLFRAFKWLGEKLSTFFSYIGNFLEWLFSGPTPPPGKPAQQTSNSNSGLFSGGWLGSLFGISPELARFIAIGILVVLVLVIAIILGRLFRRIEDRRRKSALPDDEALLTELDIPPGELPASTYESRARRYAAEGNYRMAIRELLLGSMSWVERTGLIRYRRGLTNRDYVRCVWRRQTQRDAMLQTASNFELVWFGRRTPTEDMFNTCLAGFQGAFREEETETPAT